MHDLHLKNIRGKNSVKDKALFSVDFKALLQSQLEYIQEIQVAIADKLAQQNDGTLSMILLFNLIFTL